MLRAVTKGAGWTAVLVVLLMLPGDALGTGHRPGSLDHSFHHSGRATVGFGNGDTTGNTVAYQGSKTVIIGSVTQGATTSIAVARFNANGTLDHSFGGDGRVKVRFSKYSVANAGTVLPSGKILAAGATSVAGKPDRFQVVRLERDGRLDHTFGGGDGRVTTAFKGGASYAQALTVRADGRFVVCGYRFQGAITEAALVRYRPDGGLDRTFGDGGRVVAPFPGQTSSACLGVTHDGHKTVMVGNADAGAVRSTAVARFGPGGLPDHTFDTDGFATFAPTDQSQGFGVITIPGGGLTVVGQASSSGREDVLLLQLDDQGALDPAFGGGTGYVIDDLGADSGGNAVVRQPSGRLIVAGWRVPDMAVARYLKDGTRDPGFGKNGIQAKPWSGGSSARAMVIAKGTATAAGSVDRGGHDGFAVERLFT